METAKLINKDFYVSCECGCKILKISYDKDLWNEIFFVIYGDNKSTFKRKLQMIRKIIKDGYPWEDELIISIDDIDRLINFLTEIRNEKVSLEK